MEHSVASHLSSCEQPGEGAGSSAGFSHSQAHPKSHDRAGKGTSLVLGPSPESQTEGRRQSHSHRKAGSSGPPRAGQGPGGLTPATAPGSGSNQERRTQGSSRTHCSGTSPPPLETRRAFTGMQGRALLKSP